MMVNINSYAAGLDVLGSVNTSQKPHPADGVLEVLAVRNPLTNLAMFMRIAYPTYLASANAIAFRLDAGEWMQVDGEPWHLDVGCDVLVEFYRGVHMLRAPDEGPFWRGHVSPDFWST